jgi:hypothetical protein
MGHRATVVCANFHHLMQGPQRPPGYSQVGDVDFWFVKTPAYRNNSLGRLRNNISFGRQFAADAEVIAQKCGAPDLIIASVPHLFHVPAAKRVAGRFNAKFWIEVRDLWPDSIVALGLAPPWHPLVKIIGIQERHAYRSAERVISLLGGAESHMRARGLPPGRFVWIPNGVSQTEISRTIDALAMEHPVLTRIQELKDRGKQIVVYAGAMGPPNAMEVVVEVAALTKVNPHIHFILVGGGVSREQLRIQAAGLENLEFADEVERPIAHAVLRASDCAVIVFRKNALYDHGISPNKLFDYCLCAPRCVIACDSNALDGLEGLVTGRCSPENPDLLASALLFALAAPSRRLAERVAAVERFSYSELAARYLDLAAVPISA